MNKILIFLLLLCSCTPTTTTTEKYFVVQKYHKDAGMCHDDDVQERYYRISYHPHMFHTRVTVPAKHHHSMQSAENKITLANASNTITISVEKYLFYMLTVGDIVKYDGKSISSIKPYILNNI